MLNDLVIDLSTYTLTYSHIYTAIIQREKLLQCIVIIVIIVYLILLPRISLPRKTLLIWSKRNYNYHDILNTTQHNTTLLSFQRYKHEREKFYGLTIYIKLLNFTNSGTKLFHHFDNVTTFDLAISLLHKHNI